MDPLLVRRCWTSDTSFRQYITFTCYLTAAAACIALAALCSSSIINSTMTRPAAWQQQQPPVPLGLVQCNKTNKHAQFRRDTIKWKLLELDAPASARIPAQHLWQTSRTSKLGVQATAARTSWFKLNPGLKYNLHNDSTAAQFIQDFYGSDVFAVYQCLPFGVMRADFWRYAVLYAYGGIYADIDVECLRPIRQWLPPNKTFVHQDSSGPDKWSSVGDLEYNKLTWDNCSIVIGMENDLHLCQWTLASAPGHPVLRHVITRVVEGAKRGINATYDNVVHQHTGPAVFTVAVAEALELAGHQSAASIVKAVWTNATVHKRARALGLCIAGKYFFGGQNARNLYGSQFFNTTEYPSWLREHAANKMLVLASRHTGQQAIAGDQYSKHHWFKVTLVVALLAIICGIQLLAVKTKVWAGKAHHPTDGHLGAQGLTAAGGAACRQASKGHCTKSHIDTH